MVSTKDAIGTGQTQVFPHNAYRLKKEEKSKWEFQYSGIKAKKEKIFRAKEAYKFS